MTSTKVSAGNWRVTFYVPGQGQAGRVRKQGFKTKRDADAYEQRILREHDQGQAVDEKAARDTTVATLWAQYRAHIESHGTKGGRQLRQSTLDGYDFKYRNYIEHSWQYTALSNISRESCKTWLTNMTTAAGEPVSNDARKDASSTFRRLLDYGLNQGLMSFNPMTDRAGSPLPIPAVEDRRPNVYMTLGQLMRLSSIAGRLQPLVLTAGLTGLRLNEIVGATVSDFDLGSTPTVFVPKHRSKTNEARIVPLPGQVADALRPAGMSDRPGDAPAFPAAQGGHWDKSLLGKHFRPVAARAATAIADLQAALGLEPEYESIVFDEQRQRVAVYGERTQAAVRALQESHELSPTGVTNSDVWNILGLTQLSPMRLSHSAELDRDMPAKPVFHDLRHTAVSLAIQAGVSIKMVQQMAGHKSAMVTLDVYGHLYPEDSETAAAAMTTLLGDRLTTGHLLDFTGQ